MPTRHTAPITANFGGAMKRLRSARGVTQEDMLSSSSRRHVGRIEQAPVAQLGRRLAVNPILNRSSPSCIVPTTMDRVLRAVQ